MPVLVRMLYVCYLVSSYASSMSLTLLVLISFCLTWPHFICAVMKTGKATCWGRGRWLVGQHESKDPYLLDSDAGSAS